MEIENKLYTAALVSKNPDGSRAVDRKKREITAWASKPIVDRDDELIEWNAWRLDSYGDNPVIMAGHDYHKNPIARAMWTKMTEDGLLFRAKFPTKGKSPTADEIFDLYDEGVMSAFSVGFKPHEYEDAEEKDAKPKRRYTDVELLEISAVGIPSCTGALVSAYEAGTIKSEDLNIIIKSIQDSVIQKPEVTENYIRVPVRECKITATIDISKDQGIKALYCGKEKKNATYLFAKDKGWNMAKAKKWVADHDDGKSVAEGHTSDIDLSEIVTEDMRSDTSDRSERWNKSLPEAFDVAKVEAPTTFRYALWGNFLGCKVKDIYKVSFFIPSPKLGTYLSAIKAVTSDFVLKDIRNFSGQNEIPPKHEIIQLNSTLSDDFLIDGTAFYTAEDTIKVIVEFKPEWSGMDVSLVSKAENRDWIRDLFSSIRQYAAENNFLKGESFALNGAFLEKTDDDWDGLVVKPSIKDSTTKAVNFLNKKASAMNSRGLLFIGPPGTGKTMTGRILMNQADATFIWISSRDFSDYGATSGLRLAFSMGRELAPTVLFIEDIDTWLRSYTVDLLKTEMDGLRQNKGILTILTSNYPDQLPDALLDRPGRFHQVLEFSLPDAGIRRAMIGKWTENISEKLLENIVEETEGFSGAHMRELVDFARMLAEEDEISLGIALIKSLKQLTGQRDLIAQIRNEGKSYIDLDTLVTEEDTDEIPDNIAKKLLDDLVQEITIAPKIEVEAIHIDNILDDLPSPDEILKTAKGELIEIDE